MQSGGGITLPVQSAPENTLWNIVITVIILSTGIIVLAPLYLGLFCLLWVPQVVPKVFCGTPRRSRASRTSRSF